MDEKELIDYLKSIEKQSDAGKNKEVAPSSLYYKPKSLYGEKIHDAFRLDKDAITRKMLEELEEEYARQQMPAAPFVQGGASCRDTALAVGFFLLLCLLALAVD